MFVGESGGGRCIGRGARKNRLNSGGMSAGRPQRKRDNGIGWLGTPEEAETRQIGELQEWELPRALNLEESSELLRLTHLKHIQHSTNLTLQVTL